MMVFVQHVDCGTRYVLPSAPGYGAEMCSLARYRYPDGPEWADVNAAAAVGRDRT